MMKKTILLAVLLSLLVLPGFALAAAPAATTGNWEFTLGGFIKLDTMWDSAVVNKNLVGQVPRNNDPNLQHGRTRFTANATRFSFGIKGPKIWGAQVTGYIEMDFDSAGAAQMSRSTAANAPTTETQDIGNFRLRQAFFRFNWPETELLLGQSWSFFSEFNPDAANDGAMQYRGNMVYRPAQIRLTQKFMGMFTVAGMVATPRMVGGPTGAGDEAVNAMNPGEMTETPHFEGKFSFEKDLYGKAPFYGAPRGLVAQVAVSWQQNRYRAFNMGTTSTWGKNNYSTTAFGPNWQNRTQYLNAWALMYSMFIPVIPTHSANLAGTASLTTQWSIGQGMMHVLGGWATNDSYMWYQGDQVQAGTLRHMYDRKLTQQFAGFVQGQYYFTNEWYANVVWGFMRTFGIGRNRDARIITPTNPSGFMYATPAATYDPVKYSNQFLTTLWYQPIKALKFGVQYGYTRDNYYQKTIATPGTAATTPPSGAISANSRMTSIGEDHRLEFVGIFFF